MERERRKRRCTRSCPSTLPAFDPIGLPSTVTVACPPSMSMRRESAMVSPLNVSVTVSPALIADLIAVGGGRLGIRLECPRAHVHNGRIVRLESLGLGQRARRESHTRHRQHTL